MPQQSWTIGSDSSCDIVVDSNMVSGQHCRLAREGTELTLTDLDSTNGTFVNGQRLRGSRRVSTTDRITLGQTQSMLWPESLKPADLTPKRVESSPQKENHRIITLGRGTDNTVVLSESNVSTHHARLIIDGDEIVLEDLGSTNGTSVSAMENKISRAVVRAGDTVFLGSTAYQISELVSRSQPTAIKTGDPRSNTLSRITFAKRPATLVALGLAALLTILIGWFAVRGRDASEGQKTQASATAPQTPANAAIQRTPKDQSPKSLEQSRSEPEEPAEPDDVAVSQEERLLRSLFAIVCTDPQRKTPFRVGTGFAIDADHVATSAAVIQAMQGLQQNGFPEAFLFSPATDSELRIESTTYHPQFEVANRDARTAQREHDAIFDELESEPPRPEAFEAVKDQLIAARLKALQAIDRKTTFDVAIIKVNKPLTHWLPDAGSDVALRPNQRLNVAGYAFDVEDPYFDRTAPIDLAQAPSRVGLLVQSTDDLAARMVAKAALQQDEYAYLGSPIMNAQGQVVGIYSRPTPPSSDRDSEVESTFDAALFQRLRECLTDRN